MSVMPPDPTNLSDILGDVLDMTEGAPPSSVDLAVGLFALSRLEGELMTLLEDSARAGAARRGQTGVRVLGFFGRDHRVELELDVAEGRMTGEIDPGGTAEVDIVSPSGISSVTADPMGRFRIARRAHGPCRLRVRFADGRTLLTPVIVT
jgi:hypothetical protein